MRKILLSVCLLVGTIAGLACEYNILLDPIVPLLFPVITGINASTNRIERVTVQDLNFDTSGLTGNVAMTYNPYINIYHGTGIPEVSTPVTVYIQNIYRTPFSSNQEDIQLNEITLYYRVKGDTQWVKAGVTKLKPSVYKTGIYAPFHGIPIFGHYTLDLNYPAGTIVHIAVGGSVTYKVETVGTSDKTYTAQILPPYIDDNLNAYTLSKALSEYGADTEGDHVTVQISGKRRPRHDK